MYWYASALGKWAKKKGFAVLLGQKDNVKATMDRALELAPDYFYGGPHRYFGAYYAIAPSFAGGDLEKSKVHFKKSLEIEPNYVGTKVLWAEELAVKQQDEETFDRLINEVLQTPDDVIPELVPDAGPPPDAGRRVRYVTRYVGGGGGNWSCSGSIPPAAAASRFAQNQLQFRNCYERRLKVNHQLEGRVSVNMRVNRTGEVDAVQLSGTMRDAEVLSCVRRIANNIRFPAPTGGSCAVVAAPLNFTPRN